MRMIGLVLVVALALAGCAPQIYEPGPGMDVGSIEQDKAMCRIMARATDQGVIVQGSPGFILGATLGTAIRNGIREAETYRDCMLSKGWHNKPA